MEKLAAAFKADPRVNYHLFWNSFMKAIQVRDDFRGAELPLGVEFQPEMFIPSEVMTQITSTKDDSDKADKYILNSYLTPEIQRAKA